MLKRDVMDNKYKQKLDGCRASKNMDEVISILQKENLPICIDDIYAQIKIKIHRYLFLLYIELWKN